MIHDPKNSPISSAGIIWKQPFVIEWTQLLLGSYHHWLNHELIARSGNPQEQSHQLFDSPFVVVSHVTTLSVLAPPGKSFSVRYISLLLDILKEPSTPLSVN